jgi:hypothetical protein
LGIKRDLDISGRLARVSGYGACGIVGLLSNKALHAKAAPNEMMVGAVGIEPTTSPV